MKTILIGTVLAASLGMAVHAQDMSAVNTNTPSTTYAGKQDGRFGVGLILGEPTGASLKYWLNSTLAVDGAVGWSFDESTDLHLHADLLWHKFDLVQVPEGALPFYIGVGGRIKFRDNADERVGIRMPVGVSYIFDRIPVDIFLEVAPVIDFTPSTRGGFTAGIGARFWF